MGSYCSLKVENLQLLWNKSNVIGMELFRPSDKQVIKGDDEDQTVYQYKASVSVVIQRLKALEASMQKAHDGFQVYINNLKNSYYSLLESISEREQKPIEANVILDNFDFKDWQDCIKRKIYEEPTEADLNKIGVHTFDIKEPEDVVYNDFEDHIFHGIDAPIYAVLLAILDLVIDKNNTYVILDYTDLVGGGYFSENEDLCSDSDFGKVVILTEGITDRKFIQRSLKLLCPHIYDYYTFLEFNELSLAGSTSSLVHTIKAFSAAGIKNRMIAVFDNDTAGAVAMKQLDKLPILPNIKTTKLPELDILKSYPTIGPQGWHCMNVNGLAGSIELYFEESSIKSLEGNFIPVVWKGYEESVKQYQGEILQKADVQKNFEKILNAIEAGEDISKYNFSSMIKVLETICGFELEIVQSIR